MFEQCFEWIESKTVSNANPFQIPFFASIYFNVAEGKEKPDVPEQLYWCSHPVPAWKFEPEQVLVLDHDRAASLYNNGWSCFYHDQVHSWPHFHRYLNESRQRYADFCGHHQAQVVLRVWTCCSALWLPYTALPATWPLTEKTTFDISRNTKVYDRMPSACRVYTLTKHTRAWQWIVASKHVSGLCDVEKCCWLKSMCHQSLWEKVSSLHSFECFLVIERVFSCCTDRRPWGQPLTRLVEGSA